MKQPNRSIFDSTAFNAVLYLAPPALALAYVLLRR